MLDPLKIDDIEGSRPNKWKHSKRGYMYPLENPFEKSSSNFFSMSPTVNENRLKAPNDYRGNYSVMNYNQSFNNMKNSLDSKLVYSNKSLLPEVSKTRNTMLPPVKGLNGRGTTPRDSLEAGNYGHGGFASPKQTGKLNILTEGASPKRTDRDSDMKYYGIQSPTSGRNGFYQKKAEPRDTSPEDSAKMRNPMFADYDFSKHPINSPTGKPRFIANRDDSLEQLKRGIIGDHLSYPVQPSALHKTYGDHYEVPISPGVKKTFYENVEAVKTQSTTRNPLDNTYSPSYRANNQFKMSGTVQSKPYLFQTEGNEPQIIDPISNHSIYKSPSNKNIGFRGLKFY